MEDKKNIMIAMSGGTTTVINSTLAGIISQARESENVGKIYAGNYGIKGILENEILDLTELSDEEIRLLRYTPASGFVGCSRLETLSLEKTSLLDDIFKKYSINCFINIGGNGTIKQSLDLFNKLKSKIQMIALPKTVDNDFGDREYKKLYFTPGFPSCVKYWNHKIHIYNQENLGACQHDKVLVFQTFGRETGFLAGCARIADPQRKLPLIILLPEDKRPKEEVLQKIKKITEKFGRAMVIMSEGYVLSDLGEKKDHQSQVMYGSSETTSAQILVNLLMERKIQARSIIPGPDQRDEILLSSKTDLKIAFDVGAEAIKVISEMGGNFLIGIDNKIMPTKIPLLDCDNYTRKMPEEWISKGNFDVDDEYVKYLRSFFKEGELDEVNCDDINRFIMNKSSP
jgi:ATP-dependent phosphofructokinase / diphosphate-dependent phosphofructokinase